MLESFSHLPIAAAAILTLIPYFTVAFWPNSIVLVQRLSLPLKFALPGLLAVPYVLVSVLLGTFGWGWLALYALLPVGISVLLYQAAQADPEQKGDWRDFFILLVIGLAVDLR